MILNAACPRFLNFHPLEYEYEFLARALPDSKATFPLENSIAGGGRIHIRDDLLPRDVGSAVCRNDGDGHERLGVCESADLVISNSGRDPTYGTYSGSAIARIGPTLNVSGGGGLGDGFTQLFASKLLADDNGACEAEATLVSIWKMSVSGDSIPFYARGFVEMGHSMDFTLYDITNGLELALRSISGQSGFNEAGLLESSHEYLLTTHQNALFGGGDGMVQFEFGFSAPVSVDYSDELSHLAIPEPSSLALLAAGVVLLARRRTR